MPPNPHELVDLEQAGIDVRPAPTVSNAYWGLDLEHPERGRARIAALKDLPLPPRELIEHDAKLSPEEVRDTEACGSHVSVMMEGARANVLHDRKQLLFYLRRVMGDLGVVAMDHTSQQFWSRDALDDELAHDADLDIEALFVLHAVYDPERRAAGGEPVTHWIHSHGLGELGLIDFDLLRLHESHGTHLSDLTRSLAYAIAEEHVSVDTPRFHLMHPGGHVALVDAERFAQQAPPEEQVLRDDPGGGHGDRRVVVCDPLAGGWLARLLGRAGRVRASRFLQRVAPEQGVLAFSAAATELMAQRARSTLKFLAGLLEEFEDLDLPKLVKLGYPVDGGDSEDREHLWFEIHRLGTDKIEATLVNEPFNIAELEAGDRGEHAADLVTDWQILTPIGPINPRFLGAARLVRARRDEIAAMM